MTQNKSLTELLNMNEHARALGNKERVEGGKRRENAHGDHSTQSHRHATPLGQGRDAPGRRDAQFGKPWSIESNFLPIL